MLQKKTEAVLESLNHSQQSNGARFLILEFIFFYFALNMKNLLFLSIFELLTKNCKSRENESENEKSGSITLLGMIQGF